MCRTFFLKPCVFIGHLSLSVTVLVSSAHLCDLDGCSDTLDVSHCTVFLGLHALVVLQFVVFSGRQTCSSCCFVVTQPYRILCIWFLQLFSFCVARLLIFVFNVVLCIHVVWATATYTYRNTIRWWFRAWFTLGEACFFKITQCSFNCKKPKIMNEIKMWLIVQPQWQHTMRWSESCCLYVEEAVRKS